MGIGGGGGDVQSRDFMGTLQYLFQFRQYPSDLKSIPSKRTKAHIYVYIIHFTHTYTYCKAIKHPLPYEYKREHLPLYLIDDHVKLATILSYHIHLSLI